MASPYFPAALAWTASAASLSAVWRCSSVSWALLRCVRKPTEVRRTRLASCAKSASPRKGRQKRQSFMVAQYISPAARRGLQFSPWPIKRFSMQWRTDRGSQDETRILREECESQEGKAKATELHGCSVYIAGGEARVTILAMAYQEILYAVADRVATVMLNRPDKLNAWTRTMEAEVRQAMQEAAADENVRVIVITGAGRGFCAGADMSLLQSVVNRGTHPLPASTASESAPPFPGRSDFQRQYSYFPAIPKPVIAALNGPTVGLGLVIAMYCDLRFASQDAKFGTAFAK